jgi:hypothetical protein
LGTTLDLKLWTGILAGPLAWTAQLALSYPVAQLTCYAGGASQHTGALHAISAATLVAVFAGACLAWTTWRRSVAERQRFMALLGVLSCALFAFVVIATWLPSFIMHNCEA